MKLTSHLSALIAEIWSHIKGASSHELLKISGEQVVKVFPWMPHWMSEMLIEVFPIVAFGSLAVVITKFCKGQATSQAGDARPPSFDQASELVFVSRENGSVSPELRSSCVFRGEAAHWRLKIEHASISADVNPAAFARGAGIWIALLGFVDGTAYLLSADRPTFESINVLPFGEYRFTLVSNGYAGLRVEHKWKVIVGMGHPPAIIPEP